MVFKLPRLDTVETARRVWGEILEVGPEASALLLFELEKLVSWDTKGVTTATRKRILDVITEGDLFTVFLPSLFGNVSSFLRFICVYFVPSFYLMGFCFLR
jgi:uncharacterized membrane protein